MRALFRERIGELHVHSPRKFATVVLLALTLAGCAAPGQEVSREQLSFPVASSLAGVNATDAGDLKLVGTSGIRVEQDAANGSVRLGFGPVAQVNGAIIACGAGCNTSSATSGMVVADGSLISHNDLGLNAHGPDRDSTIYFFDDGLEGGQHIRWTDAADRFQLSHDTEVLGELLVHGPVGTVSSARTTSGSYVFTAALEGNEQGIYLRGSATLANGTVTIGFPEAFTAVVGNGTITAQVTLTSPGPTLYVSEKTRDHITVAAVTPFDGTVTLDWFVQAPRAGGEAFQTVR